MYLGLWKLQTQLLNSKNHWLDVPNKTKTSLKLNQNWKRRVAHFIFYDSSMFIAVKWYCYKRLPYPKKHKTKRKKNTTKQNLTKIKTETKQTPSEWFPKKRYWGTVKHRRHWFSSTLWQLEFFENFSARVVFQRCSLFVRNELTGGQPETVDDFYWLSAREHWKPRTCLPSALRCITWLASTQDLTEKFLVDSNTIY